MVIYTREEKTLIIPEGLGGYVTGDCRAIAEEAREQGYESGYTQGYNDGVLADCGEAIEEAFNDGFESGYTQGQAECPECDCTEECTICYNQGYADGRQSVTSGCPMQSKSIRMSGIETSVSPDYGYAGMDSVYINAEDVYNDAYSTGYTEGYQSGYTAGQADCSGASLENGTYELDANFSGDSGAILPNYPYDGFDSFRVVDIGYGYSKYQHGHAVGVEDGFRMGYQSGYTAGQQDCSGGTCNLESGQASLGYDWTGFTRVYPSQGYDGFSDVIVADLGYGQRKYDEGYADGIADCSGSTPCDCSSAVTEAYQSGYTEGWDNGFMSGAGVELVDYIHSTNMGNNVEEYLVTNIIPTKYTKAKFAGQYKQYTTYGVLVGFNDSGDSQDWRLFVFENGAPITYGALETMFDVGLTRTEMGAGTYSVNDDLWFEWGYESGSTIMRSPQISRTFAMVDREPAQGYVKINMGIMWVSSVQIWDNGTLVFNGKAAKRNNDYGLWDSVSKTFLTDANLNLVGETNLNNN